MDQTAQYLVSSFTLKRETFISNILAVSNQLVETWNPAEDMLSDTFELSTRFWLLIKYVGLSLIHSPYCQIPGVVSLVVVLTMVEQKHATVYT